MINQFEMEDDMTTPLYDLDNESYQTFVDFIYDSCKDWLTSAQDHTIFNNLNDTLTKYVFDMINNDPFINFETIKHKIETEINEMLFEEVYTHVRVNILRKLPDYFDWDTSHLR
jgi:hypothetical protein